MNNKSPAFQFYPGDFLSDENVISMTFEERGVYITLLSNCWIQGSIPADPDKIIRLLPGYSNENGVPSQVMDCFVPMATDPRRLVHPRLEKELQKQDEWREKSSQAGKKSAENRQIKRNFKGGSNLVQPNSNSSVFSLQSSSSSSNNKQGDSLWEKEKQEAFENRWKTYPGKKDGHKAAMKHWNASIKKPEDIENYDLAIENYQQSVSNDRHNGFKDLNWKNGSTWFNNWQDYIPQEAPPPEPGEPPDPPNPREPTDPALEKLWSDCLEMVKSQVSAESYLSFESSYPISLESGILLIACSNQITRKMMIENYREMIELFLKEVSGNGMLVDFCIAPP